MTLKFEFEINLIIGVWQHASSTCQSRTNMGYSHISLALLDTSVTPQSHTSVTHFPYILLNISVPHIFPPLNLPIRTASLPSPAPWPRQQ